MSFSLTPFALVTLFAVTATTAMAAGPHVSGISLGGYIKTVAEKMGRTEDSVRDEAVESLRGEGRFSDEDLARIGRAAADSLDEAKRSEMVKALEESESFSARIGLEAVRSAPIADRAGVAFDALAFNSVKTGAEKSVDLSSNTQKAWADTLFGLNPGPQKVYASIDARFELQVTAREFPPYGDTYRGTLFLNGAKIKITDKALLTSLATELLKQAHRSGPFAVLRGKMTAERIARETPPYGFEQAVTVTLE